MRSLDFLPYSPMKIAIEAVIGATEGEAVATGRGYFVGGY
jgi:hypothetical protein